MSSFLFILLLQHSYFTSCRYMQVSFSRHLSDVFIQCLFQLVPFGRVPFCQQGAFQKCHLVECHLAECLFTRESSKPLIIASLATDGLEMTKYSVIRISLSQDNIKRPYYIWIVIETFPQGHIRAISIFIVKTLYTYEIMWNGSGIIKEVEM